MPHPSQTLHVILIVTITVIGLSVSFYLFRQPGSAEGVSNPMIAEVSGTPTRELHVLFIGNSYTFFNNMPGMLVQIARSDSDNHTRYIVQSVTRGGIGLKELWDDGAALKLLKENHWDYVVLQEQSFWAMFPEAVNVTSHAAGLFDQEIKQASAHTLLFTTCARQPVSHWYQDEKYSFLRSPDYMQQQFDRNTKDLADRLGAVAIPVGDFWASALAKQPSIPLYIGDGSHPSPAGSYLAALVFYRYFAEHNPDHVTYAPENVAPEQAVFLRNIASW